MAIRYPWCFSYTTADATRGTASRPRWPSRCYLEPHFDREDELQVDHEQLGGDDDIDRKIARAMCASVATTMI